MRVREDCNTFFEGVADLREEIDGLRDQICRILLLSLLDTLAGCAFPKEQGNKSRFVRFIDRRTVPTTMSLPPELGHASGLLRPAA